MSLMSHPVTRTLLAGTLLGLIILGGGGRLAMALITYHAGGSPQFSFGGSMTVVMLGAASGLGGATMLLFSRFVALRSAPNFAWLSHVLFAALLFLVTLRGLKGQLDVGRWYFFPLVAIYGAALALIARRQRRSQIP